MKFVKLLTAAYVGGALRHPHEGVLHVNDEDAERLFENDAAIDVSDDFSKSDDKTLPVDSVTVQSGAVPVAEPEHPHQSEIAPTTDPDPAPAKKAKG